MSQLVVPKPVVKKVKNVPKNIVVPKTITQNAKKARKRRRKNKKTKGGNKAQQLRADPRANADQQRPSIVYQSALSTLVQPVSVDQVLIQDFVRGMIMKAIEKGAQAFSENPWFPYFAYIYGVQTLRAIIMNDPPKATMVPFCFLTVGRAARSKDVTFGNGTVSYACTVSPYVEPTVNEVVGYTPYGYQWTLGIPSSTMVNVRFPQVSESPPGYTDEEGAEAFQRVCQILINKDGQNPWRMVQLSSSTPMDSDVSIFSFCPRTQRCVGLGTLGAAAGAGFSSTIGLEVPIRCPQFAAFNSGTFAPALLQRQENLHAQLCGDGTFLGAGMGSWFTEDKWHMQRPPKLHPIHLEDFVFIIGEWVVGMQNAFVNDPANSAITSRTSDLVCPLSLQEMVLLVRNVLMSAFKNTQAGVHAMYPIVPASDTDSQFVPLVVSSNTAFISSVPMTLPLILIENMRSLVGRFIHRQGSDYEFFIPVLGQEKDYVYDSSAYYFTSIDGSGTVDSFSTISEVVKQKVTTKTGEVLLPLVEATVSMIDGSYTGGYVCINDPTALRELSAMWEDWLKRTGLLQYSAPVSTLGTELGINVLCSINMTRMYGTIEVTEESKKHLQILNLQPKRVKRSTDVIDSRSAKKKRRSKRVTDLDEIICVADLSQSVILDVPYSQIQGYWVLPRVKQFVDSNNSINVVRWSSVNSEPYAILLTDGEEGVSLGDVYSQFAQSLVRGKLQPPTELDKLLEALAAQGRGGILSGLVSKFADAIVPGSGGLVTQIGNAIGI
jgi:hypothetical protein